MKARSKKPAEISDPERPKPPKGKPFEKGQSGNPGGRPKGYAEAREACRQLDSETLAVLVGLMRDGESEQVRAMCAIRIRDEAWGKPKQAVEVSAQSGTAVSVESVRVAAAALLVDAEARKALRAAVREGKA